MLIALGFTLVSGPVAAQVPILEPLKLDATYDVDWNNLGIGRIRMTAREDAAAYTMTIDTKTHGFAKLFSDEGTVATVEGHRTGTDAYLPSHYTSVRSKADQGKTDLRYDAGGKLIARVHVPDDDPSWRPPVPADEANTATDPITAAFIARHKIRDNMEANIRDTVIRTYDGSRLAEMHFTVISPARVEIGHAYRDAINVVVVRTPINGYTPKELKKFKKGDPVIHLYFSTDAQFMPIKATISAGYGDIEAVLNPGT